MNKGFFFIYLFFNSVHSLKIMTLSYIKKKKMEEIIGWGLV